MYVNLIAARVAIFIDHFSDVNDLDIITARESPHYLLDLTLILRVYK